MPAKETSTMAKHRKPSKPASAGKHTTRRTPHTEPVGSSAAIPAPPGPAGQASTAAAPAGAPQVCVRFYCQGIGDCHLLRFAKKGGGDFWMLIDCGIHS